MRIDGYAIDFFLGTERVSTPSSSCPEWHNGQLPPESRFGAFRLFSLSVQEALANQAECLSCSFRALKKNVFCPAECPTLETL